MYEQTRKALQEISDELYRYYMHNEPISAESARDISRRIDGILKMAGKENRYG